MPQYRLYPSNTVTNTTVDVHYRSIFDVCALRDNNSQDKHRIVIYPCEGGVEYLHRDPASRRRRRKRKSQIWDSKIWSRVPRDSDQRKTTLARASSIYKRQTRPLVREGAPQKQDRNSQIVINIWSWAPADRQSQCDFDLRIVIMTRTV
jgi:hypothetical protein